MSPTWIPWIAAFSVLLATSGYLLFRLLQFRKLTFRSEEPPTRVEFRQSARRMFVGVGLWQISIGAVILTSPGPTSPPLASAITVIGVGVCFLLGCWISAKFDSAIGAIGR